MILSPKHLLPTAQKALGLSSLKEQQSVDYWINVGNVTREELVARLADQGIRLSPQARRIPKNSLRRLRRIFNQQSVLPETVPQSSQPLPPLRWEIVGRERMLRFLTEEEIGNIHRELENDFADSPDPMFPPGVKDLGLLSMAASRPSFEHRGIRKYPTLEMASAALFHSVVHNHAFHNGNRRTAVVALLAMLDENGAVLTCPQKELFRFTLITAQHRLVPENADERSDREVMKICDWIRAKRVNSTEASTP